jgi:hypothetical protein
MLIFRRDIFKKKCKKEYPRFGFKKDQYTLVSNFEFEKKLTNISFSLRKMQLKSSPVARSIDNFDAHYINCLDLKYIYKS